MNEIQHEKTQKGGAFYLEINGRRLAQMVYVMAGEKTMVIEHTDVDEQLKGQGVGKKLLGQLVKYVREHQIKVIPLCPFANATLQKTPEWQDILGNAGLKLKT